MSHARKEVIGDCTLYLGDCLEILPTLGEVDAVVTDPPYGMAFRSNYRSIKHRAIKNDTNMDLLFVACSLPAKHSKYIFCRWDSLKDVPQPRSVVTWVKNNWSMGDLSHEHARQTEIILFYPGEQHDFPTGRPQDVIRAPRTENNFHPTEKSTELMRGVVGWTRGIVLDPFMGSGTTGVACVKMGRKFIGIEIDPDYFEIACKRIREAYAQPDMFIEAEKSKAEQLPLISEEAAQ